MSAAVIFRMGADTKGLKADLEAAGQLVRKLLHSQKGGVLKSDNKIEATLSELTNRMALAQTSGQALAATLESVTDILNLPLAAGAGLGVGVALATGLIKASEETQKLAEALKQVIVVGEGLGSLDGVLVLENQIKQIAAAVAQMEKKRGTYAFFAEGLDDMWATDAAETGEGKRAAARTAASDAIRGLIKDTASAQSALLDIQDQIVAGDTRAAGLAKARLEYETKIAQIRRDAKASGATHAETKPLLQVAERAYQQDKAAVEDQTTQKANRERDAANADYRDNEIAAQAEADQQLRDLKDKQSKEEQERREFERQQYVEFLGLKTKAEEAAAEKKKKLNDDVAKAQADGQKRLAQIDQNADQAKAERSKATLAELAGNAKNQHGMKARQAQRLEERANKFRVRGDDAKAGELQQRADDLKRGIGALKDSEKGADFQAALEKAQVLKDIRDNVQNLRNAQ